MEHEERLTVAFLEDPSQWPTEVLQLQRNLPEGPPELGFLFPGKPHVYLDRSGKGPHYAYPSFEAIIGSHWKVRPP